MPKKKKNGQVVFALFLAGALSLTAGSVAAAGFESEVKLGVGFRTAQLDWNIAGDESGANPNILSELTWRDLSILDFTGELSGANANGYFFRGTLNYGLVWEGESQDSDYDGDNRTLEWSRSINDVDGSSVWGAKLGIGKEIPFGIQHQHRLIPLIGLNYQVQDMRMTDGNQVIPNTGSIPGLKSSYEATWAGYWLGGDVQWSLDGGAQLQARLEYHWAQYDAEANWNLRDDFKHPVSFEHEADGNGLVFGLGWRKPLEGGRWVLGLDLAYEFWSTDPGKDYTYVTQYEDAGGNTVYCTPYCVGVTQLNEVNWSSSSVLLTVSREI